MTASINGTTGVTFPDASVQGTAATGFGFKNRIINGAMMIDQRNAGASKTYTTGSGVVYFVDRWFVFASGANVTVQQVAGTNTGTAYATRLTGGSGSTAVNFGQRLESKNVSDLNSVSVTVKAKVYASSSISNCALTIYTCSGTDSGYGAATITSPVTVNSGLNTVTATFSLPATAANGLEFDLQFTSGIGSGVFVDISEVQLEKGSTATSFDYRPYGTELALCQRYYETITFANYRGITCQARGANDTNGWIGFKVTKRAVPTMSTSGTFGAWTNTSGTNAATVSFTSNAITVDGSGVDVATSGMAAGNASLLVGNSGGTIISSAEL